MKFTYEPKGKLEIFGKQIYLLLVENFSHTYFAGGMVRDLLLGKKVTDIDIATSATPEEMIKIFKYNCIHYMDTHKNFGNITLIRGGMSVEVTTFRKDLKGDNRYNKVVFIKNAKEDSKRRDFTINSLYLSLKQNKIFDFHKGLIDLKNKKIRFIGNPIIRINEDPLRIIRALRFALSLNLKLGSKTKFAIKYNLNLTQNLTETKIEKEILKLKKRSQKNILKSVLVNQNLLDKYFK